MIQLLKTKTGRLRILGILEGTSLLVLIFIGVPLKYMWHIPDLSRMVGTIHGALFLLFVFNTLSLGVEQKWKFREITWKVLLASVLPFGTFYIDRKILARLEPATVEHQ